MLLPLQRFALLLILEQLMSTVHVIIGDRSFVIRE